MGGSPILHPHESHAIRFLLGHLVIGVAGGLLFGLLLLATDLFGLRGLLREDEQGWLAAALLFFGLGVTFGSIAMGVGIMALGREKS